AAAAPRMSPSTLGHSRCGTEQYVVPVAPGLGWDHDADGTAFLPQAAGGNDRRFLAAPVLIIVAGDQHVIGIGRQCDVLEAGGAKRRPPGIAGRLHNREDGFQAFAEDEPPTALRRR